MQIITYTLFPGVRRVQHVGVRGWILLPLQGLERLSPQFLHLRISVEAKPLNETIFATTLKCVLTYPSDAEGVFSYTNIFC